MLGGMRWRLVLAVVALLASGCSSLLPSSNKVGYGVVVIDVAHGSAGRSGIQPGDVIVAVNQTRFSSIEEFARLIEQQKKGSKVALLVRRGDASLYVPMEVG